MKLHRLRRSGRIALFVCALTALLTPHLECRQDAPGWKVARISFGLWILFYLLVDARWNVPKLHVVVRLLLNVPIGALVLLIAVSTSTHANSGEPRFEYFTGTVGASVIAFLFAGNGRVAPAVWLVSLGIWILVANEFNASISGG